MEDRVPFILIELNRTPDKLCPRAVSSAKRVDTTTDTGGDQPSEAPGGGRSEAKDLYGKKLCY